MFFNIFESIKRKKALFLILIIATVVVSILGIYSAINFESVAITIDIGNVSFIKFLKGSSGFMAFIFGTLLVSAVFYLIILICCSKKFLIPFAILFYLYFVYSQMVIFTSLIVIYGFFNVLILLIFLLAFLLAEFFIFILLVLELTCFCGSACYFKDCFNKSISCVPILSLIFLALVLVFCLLLTILKSFIILLIF